MKVKYCWLAKEYSKGWRLGLAIGNRTPKYIPYWFKDEQEIKDILGANIIFVHMAEGK